ncbi:ATP-binding cassette subfamily B protein/ATP-binding cassette subfamily C protein [Micromonospora violae]|uniref:ATP-binding cassette subfamily B protein/ATP-binding cassette subfamily C protein n=1 Tax=Micromonospora violae TaxID=1278207 RepID=A0A4V2FNU8_9ACTN|nr:ABC transporter ATP-binding protein [Micromonospora violae]RZT78290.1 ATP-binding cassette subfamily B protein/ATP-binding cassette subfamily C protein [Micromonospora violae]
MSTVQDRPVPGDTPTDRPGDGNPTGRSVGLAALLPYLREHRATLIVVGALSLAGSAASLAQPLLTRSVLDRIGAEQGVSRLVAVLVALVVLSAAIGGLRDYLLQRTAEGLVLGTRRRLAGHLLRLPIAEYDRRRTGDLLSRVGSDTTLLRAVVTSGLFETVTGAVTVVGAGTAMVLLDPLLFGVTLLGVALGLGFAATFARRVRALARAAQERIGEMTSAVERAISAARTIRASRAETRETETVTGSAREAYAAGLRVARVQALVGPIGSVTVQGAFLLVLGIGGARVAAGAISVGDLVAFVMYLFLLALPLGQVLRAYTQLQSGLGALARIEEILAVPAEGADDRPAPTVATATPRRATPMIEFDRVGFGYPGGEPVLHEVSFAVPAGTRTALVGPSGAGKSTLLALVERFYEVSAGAVRLDGHDVRDLPRDALRARLGYVEQEAPVLAGTLRENLLITTPDATDDRLREVLDEANLGHLAQRTPQGLDVQVGEGGVLLSGGERQRLAIARALLAGPPVLLLDEPTSNLDSRNEAALRRAIDAVAVRRTLLIVAHRLATVVDADQIVVLDGGRVVAVGTHAELTATDPLYRELASHQLLVG